MNYIQLSTRQTNILEIVKKEGPITGEQIAERLHLSRAALRSDLAILSMSGLIGARPKVGYYFTGTTVNELSSSNLNNIFISAVLSRPILVREHSSIYDAIIRLFIEDVGTLFVVSENDYLEGVLSRKDLLKATIGSKHINEMPVSVSMTRMPNIIYTTPEESVFTAAQKLIHHQIDALPVVTTEKVGEEIKYKVIGRFTKTNITRLLVNLAENKIP